MTAVETELATITDIEPYLDEDDGREHKTHIINPPMNTHIWVPGMSTKDVVDVARLTGVEIVALCGYRWIPKRNPDKYDICENCMSIAGELIKLHG